MRPAPRLSLQYLPDESLHLRRTHLECFDGEYERASDEISRKEGVHPGRVSPGIFGLQQKPYQRVTR